MFNTHLDTQWLILDTDISIDFINIIALSYQKAFFVRRAAMNRIFKVDSKIEREFKKEKEMPCKVFFLQSIYNFL